MLFRYGVRVREDLSRGKPEGIVEADLPGERFLRHFIPTRI